MTEGKDNAFSQPEEGTAVKEPAANYARRTEIPTFFGEPLLRGTFIEISQESIDVEKPTLFYHHPNGEIWVGDCIAWLVLQRHFPDMCHSERP